MSEPQTIAVEFKRVMKSFGTKRVLNDVSFHIDQGQALCLLGPSGVWKERHSQADHGAHAARFRTGLG